MKGGREVWNFSGYLQACMYMTSVKESADQQGPGRTALAKPWLLSDSQVLDQKPMAKR